MRVEHRVFRAAPKKSIEEIFEFEKLPARKFFIRVQRNYLENFTTLEFKTSEETIENALRRNVVDCPVRALACFEYR